MSEIRPGVWRFRVSVEDPISGKSVQRSKTVRTKTRPSKKDPFRAGTGGSISGSADILTKRATGKKATVGKLLDDWLANLAREGRAKTTLETYRSHAETRIRPALGAVPLDRMDPTRIRAFLGSLSGSPRTIRLTHAILRGALAFAWWRMGWITENPATRVRPPRLDEDRAEALTPAEVAEMILTAQKHSDAMGMAVFLAAVTGCRRGELCGLRWSDVDWDRQTLRIERAFVPGQGGQVLGPTKTKDCRTLISVRGRAIQTIKGWELLQKATYGEVGEWLLSDSDGTEPLRAKTVTETFTRLARAAGIDAHFHDLRKFATTQLVAGGVDVTTISLRQGHSPEVLLKTYSKGVAERDAAASVALGEIIMQELPK